MYDASGSGLFKVLSIVLIFVFSEEIFKKASRKMSLVLGGQT